MKILSVFSDTYSVGIPIGGPASRLLSELALNQVDQLLLFSNVQYCRYSDDYHIFADSYENAFKSLTFLSQKLLQTQVLQLQKAKTRMMTREEFLATTPKQILSDGDTEDPSLLEQSQRLMWFSIKFDPYSQNSQEDYQRLRDALERFDILAILKSELQKSRVHIPLTKKLLQAMRFLSPESKDGAAISLFNNIDLVYPVLASILITIYEVFEELGNEAADFVIDSIAKLISGRSYVMELEVHLSYAIRIISKRRTAAHESLLDAVYRRSDSEIVRRDIILVMARWKSWHWLSDRRLAFRSMGFPERRALIVASYVLKDEGRHWRGAIKRELTPLENLVREWASEKIPQSGWQVPI